MQLTAVALRAAEAETAEQRHQVSNELQHCALQLIKTNVIIFEVKVIN